MKAMHLPKIISALFRAKYLGAHIPLVTSIIPTNRCNLHCLYCTRWERPGPELPVESWETIIDELHALGCVQLSVTGGEPLLYQGIERLIFRGKNNGMTININTNGLLATRKKDVLALADSVTISIDGDQSLHDELRGSGSFDIAVKGAQIAGNLGKGLTLYCVISRRNVDQLHQVVDLASGLGGQVIFQPGTLMDFGGDKNNPEAPDVKSYRNAIDRLIKLKKQGRPIGNSAAGLKYLRQWPDPAPIKCYGGSLFVRIEPDGNMRLCGRDGGGPKNDVTDGLAIALTRCKSATCESCWSSARVEFNLLAQANPSALWSFLRS